MKRLLAMVATVTAIALVLTTGTADAAKTSNKKKRRTTTTTLLATTSTVPLRSTLTVSACHLELDDQGKLAPLAISSVGSLPETGGTVGAVKLKDPVPVSIKESGNLVTCAVKAGADERASEDTFVFDVVDFPGPKGTDAAKSAYATVKTAYSKQSNASGSPEDLTGLGDEAFVAKRDNGNAEAFVAREGEIVVRVDGSQSSSSVGAPIDFDAVKAATATILAQAVAQVPTSTGSSTSSSSAVNPKGNDGTGRITTKGAVNATWKIRIADLGISEGCSIIPLITEDGKLTGWVNPLTSGSLTFSSANLNEDLKGTKGATVVLPTDLNATHPAFHVEIDSVVREQFTGKNKTAIKGSFDYTCAIN